MLHKFASIPDGVFIWTRDRGGGGRDFQRTHDSEAETPHSAALARRI